MACTPSEDSDQPCTHWVAKDPMFLHADSENSDQTGRIILGVHFCCFVGPINFEVLCGFRHNDLAWRYRYYAKNQVYGQHDLRTNLTEVWTNKDEPSHTDIPRLRKGKVGGQVLIYFYQNVSSEIDLSWGQTVTAVLHTRSGFLWTRPVGNNYRSTYSISIDI